MVMPTIRETLAAWSRQISERYESLSMRLRRLKDPAHVDLAGRIGLFIPATTAILIIVLILTFLWYESMPILTSDVGGPAIFLEPTWDPNRDLFGIGVFIAGSLVCTGIALGVALPVGIGAAIFLSEFCPSHLRDVLRMIIEMMAAVPSIVYGLWAYTVMVPWIRDSVYPAVSSNPLLAWVPFLQGPTNGYSALAGGLILAIMLLPTVVSVSDDALRSVPRSLREASLALGASESETALKVVLRAALPGVGAAIVLSLGRAVGETMAVLMVTGNSLTIPYSLFDPCYVMTSIITNQLGYAFVFPLWRSALFAVALVLMLMSICFTAIAKVLIWRGTRIGAVV